MKFFSLIYQGDIHTSTDEKVIPAEEYSTLLDAATVLEKAKEDAETYRKEVDEECEKLREKARNAGFDEGLATFNEHLIAFDKALRELRLELQNSIIPLALKAAKKIVGKELESHPETIVDIVLQTLAPVTQNQRITIYVNKADKEILETNRPRIKKVLEHIQNLSIQDRSDIAPGGCVIETESGIINATIENQWRALESAFEKYMKH